MFTFVSKVKRNDISFSGMYLADFDDIMVRAHVHVCLCVCVCIIEYWGPSQ